MQRHLFTSTRMDRSRRTNPAVLYGVIVGGVATGIFVVIAVLVALAVWSQPRPQTDAPGVIKATGGTDGSKRTYSRDEFAKLVMGKTPEEVIAAVGRPDEASGDPFPMWTYDRTVINPVTGKLVTAFVHFRDGKVSNVGY